ncbi:MAG TPA: Ldh family oxidoreductase [Rhodothermales bacterium]
MTKTLRPDALRDLCRRLLAAAGLSRRDAELVTDVLLFADVRGIESHGVQRLPFYLKRLSAGGTDPRATPVVRNETASTALIDAANGMGQVACMAATDLAARKAKQTGSACVGVMGSSHNGALSYYAVTLAEQDLLGFVFTNTTPLMAAWGGRGSVLGNNPMAFAAPFRPGLPFVFDAAMSTVAAGKVRAAAKSGSRIPVGWIVDEHGRDTDDPADFERGTLLPFGQHKGYGLALVVEIMASVLTGAGMLHQNPFWQEAVETPLSIGHAILAIDVQSFMPVETFRSRMEWLASSLKQAPPAEGSSGVLVPGELEQALQTRRSQEGIPVAVSTWDALVAAAADWGVELPE